MQYFNRQKFKEGGATQAPSEEELAQGIIKILIDGGLSENDAPEIAQAFIQTAGGVKEAAESVSKLAAEGAQPKDITAQIVQLVQQAVAKAKCGMKLEYYKKLRQGGKPKKKCPCMLKRVGGRLIEVDSCTGLPVLH